MIENEKLKAEVVKVNCPYDHSASFVFMMQYLSYQANIVMHLFEWEVTL